MVTFKSKNYEISLPELYARLEKIENINFKLLTNTPPILIRQLGKDNLYRTFMVDAAEDSIHVKVSATKTDDTEKEIENFVKELKVEIKPLSTTKAAEAKAAKKKRSLEHFNMLEAEFYRRKGDGEFTEEQANNEQEKLKALKEKVDNGEDIGKVSKPWDKKKPATRKERAQLLRATKKKKRTVKG